MCNVALVYNLKQSQEKGLPVDYCSEFDSQQTVEAIAQALRLGGHKVFLVEAGAGLLEWLRLNQVDIVFNIAEGSSGVSREAQVPAILDFLGIPYTGSGVLAMVLSMDKARAKQIFLQRQIPTPKFHLFKKGDRLLFNSGFSLSKKSSLSPFFLSPFFPELQFPLMVKPNCEGSAKGIHASSVVSTHARLQEEMMRIKNLYRQDVLAEEFIEGTELTVGILGNQRPQILPILEIDFTNCRSKGEFFYSWEVKEYQGIDPRYPDPEFFCPARLTPDVAEKVKEVAWAAHQALDCLDCSRVDIRLSNDNIPYVLEVNALPGLDPQESNLPFMAKAANLAYPDLVNGILNSALARIQRSNVRSLTSAMAYDSVIKESP